ncbi:MAG TPA: thymidylate synthase [Baekduia sp.]|uniref:thymidylate synthase n=1 Tax=Baekduia sp. TaxID=2600305 RepID=UPI002D775BE8|nr:thymidylate synthase [Baekduia sp.]HET6509279.1 thymidylate synthase [Baekduia sp.]
MADLTFDALHHADRLRLVNPRGDVGVITLWSPWEAARRKLEEVDPAILDPTASRVAAIGNLYGDGMYALLCNLLHNPQVRHLIALGTQAGPSTTDDLEVFFADGLEDDAILGRPVRRIPGTGRVFPADAAFDDRRLREHLSFHHLGRLSAPGLPDALRALLRDLPRADPATLPPRVRIELDADAGDRRRQPSDVLAHQVVRRRPLDVWEELVVRTLRFGSEVGVGDGTRLELLNVKAVVAEPADDAPAALEHFGLRAEDLRAYQRRILDPSPPDGVAYTYGHRLRGHTIDTLAEATALLAREPTSRRAYISLWDDAIDLHAGPGAATPCLTTIWLRIAEDGRLTLTATYRAHNLLTAWVQNVYGLMAVQCHVGDALGLAPGPITVVSHALGINPADSRFALARDLESRWLRDDDRDRAAGKSSMREDPHGYFVVSIDDAAGELVAEHRYEGLLVKTYRARRAETIMHEVAADMAVSLVSHALWLGGELRRHEARL